MALNLKSLSNHRLNSPYLGCLRGKEKIGPSKATQCPSMPEAKNVVGLPLTVQSRVKSYS